MDPRLLIAESRSHSVCQVHRSDKGASGRAFVSRTQPLVGILFWVDLESAYDITFCYGTMGLDMGYEGCLCY